MSAKVIPLLVVALWLQSVGVFLLTGDRTGWGITLLLLGLGLLLAALVRGRREQTEG